MAPVTLYHLEPSHHCEKARKVLEYKGIEHTIERVPYQDHGDLIRATGQDYTPAILTEKGGVVVWDKLVTWAEETAPTPTLFPGEDPAQTAATSRLIEHWAHTMVEDATWRHVVSRAPDQFTDLDERWRFVEFQERKWGPLEEMEAARERTLSEVEHVCRLAEDQLGGTPFLLGEEPSLADLALYGGLHPLAFTGEGIPDGFDALAAWWERVDGL